MPRNITRADKIAQLAEHAFGGRRHEFWQQYKTLEEHLGTFEHRGFALAAVQGNQPTMTEEILTDPRHAKTKWDPAQLIIAAIPHNALPLLESVLRDEISWVLMLERQNMKQLLAQALHTKLSTFQHVYDYLVRWGLIDPNNAAEQAAQSSFNAHFSYVMSQKAPPGGWLLGDILLAICRAGDLGALRLFEQHLCADKAHISRVHWESSCDLASIRVPEGRKLLSQLLRMAPAGYLEVDTA